MSSSAVWIQGAVVIAADDAGSDCPSESILCEVGDAACVGELAHVGAGGCGSVCIAIEDGDELLTSNGAVRAELAVSDALHDLIGVCPVHCVCVLAASFNVAVAWGVKVGLFRCKQHAYSQIHLELQSQ